MMGIVTNYPPKTSQMMRALVLVIFYNRNNSASWRPA